MKRKERERAATAHHEAAHAVVCGLVWGFFGINPDGESGSCYYDPGLPCVETYMGRMMAAAAGPAGSKYYLGWPHGAAWWRIGEGDKAVIERLKEESGLTWTDADHRAVNKLVRDNWHENQRLAAALLASPSGRLTRAEFDLKQSAA